MQNDYDYFLLIAEELNISHAAKKAYTSQQNLSKYLKHLEDELGTPLFSRRPQFSLTPAGEIALRRIRQMKTISANMKMELDELDALNTGKIVFASSTGRMMRLLPVVFPLFHKMYPRVSVDARMGLTVDTLGLVSNGTVDVLLGIQPGVTPDLKEILLDEEQFYVAISDEMLMQSFPNEFPDCKLRFSRGIDLREFSHVPFFINSRNSHLKMSVDAYLIKHDITNLNHVLVVEDGETQLEIVQKGCGACFFVAMLRSVINDMNAREPAHFINYFPLQDNQERNRISIVYKNDQHMPAYTQAFIRLLCEHYEKNFIIFDSLSK